MTLISREGLLLWRKQFSLEIIWSHHVKWAYIILCAFWHSISIKPCKLNTKIMVTADCYHVVLIAVSTSCSQAGLNYEQECQLQLPYKSDLKWGGGNSAGVTEVSSMTSLFSVSLQLFLLIPFAQYDIHMTRISGNFLAFDFQPRCIDQGEACHMISI